MNIYRRSNKQQIRNEKKGRKFTIYFHKFIKRRKKKINGEWVLEWKIFLQEQNNSFLSLRRSQSHRLRWERNLKKHGANTFRGTLDDPTSLRHKAVSSPPRFSGALPGFTAGWEHFSSAEPQRPRRSQTGKHYSDAGECERPSSSAKIKNKNEAANWEPMQYFCGLVPPAAFSWEIHCTCSYLARQGKERQSLY